ncbi:N-6 DNA methylase [Streptomyces sp. NPDC048603]|uniref:N-6 DNA methylase n=1 Tax=Streptomyces sp. NPDC048603 TaxID=3365577 RepID=UPI00371027A1
MSSGHPARDLCASRPGRFRSRLAPGTPNPSARGPTRPSASLPPVKGPPLARPRKGRSPLRPGRRSFLWVTMIWRSDGMPAQAKKYVDGRCCGDTPADPLHMQGDGRRRRFDRVLNDAPFSMNYTDREIEHPERMRYGWTPAQGKRADWMNVQHVLAVLRPDGIGAVVTPHGVLFRGGSETEIRRGIIEDDRLEAVIGIARSRCRRSRGTISTSTSRATWTPVRRRSRCRTSARRWPAASPDTRCRRQSQGLGQHSSWRS